ncbi:MAG: hypothetical protein KC912_01115, partial [Proteobacteria bacterium]|nr:hypothetical protein [Pseudomonadota bacterium]
MKRMVPLLLLALALPSAAEEPATATFTKEANEEKEKSPVSLTFTNDLEIRYWVIPARLEGHEDRDVLNYFEQVERFTAHASTQNGWQAFAQVDQVLLSANAYKLDGVYTKERELRGPSLYWPGPERWDLYANPEKLYLSKKTG